MYYEEPRIPALPGEENVTDGSVDDYGTDWENAPPFLPRLQPQPAP